MKKYLKCTVTQNNGNTFDNPLMIKEAYLISRLAQENKCVVVTLVECDKDHYNFIFGL